MAADHRVDQAMVPLHERMRMLHLYRLVVLVAVAVSMSAGWLPTVDRGSQLVAILVIAVVTSVVTFLAGTERERLVERRQTLHSSLLIVDSGVFVWLSLVTGGLDSPVRYSLVIHVVLVCLLSAFRSGLKLALWHTLVLMTGLQAAAAGLVPATGPEGPILPLLLLLWSAMLVTAGAASVNERELRRRRYDLARLAQYSEASQRLDDPNDVAATMLAEVVDLAGAGPSLLVDVSTSTVVARTCDDGDAGAIEDVHALALARDEERTLHLAALDRERDGWLASLLPEARNITIMPLLPDGRVTLLLVLQHQGSSDSRVGQQVIESVERTATHGALAYANATLRVRLDHLARTDALTGIANRAAYNAALDREVRRASRYDQPLSLAVLDIDHFKHFNDTHGHLVGDEVLRGVAQTLAGQMRDVDIFARTGGEEFAVLLPATTIDEARRIAERLRIGASTVSAPSPVTVSIGLAEFRDDENGVRLMDRADRALYAAKDAGRNCVRLADEPATELTVT